jgi:4-hydroxythreonine-4-phosphate dehydrogenase
VSGLPLAVSVGCPSGIGPEVAVAASADFPEPLVLVGDRAQLTEIAASLGVSIARHEVLQPGQALAASERSPGQPCAAGGAAQLAWVDAATDLVTSGKARALVTGPVSKESIARSGAPGSTGFLGHTEHLQRRLGADEVVMAFWSERIATALVTTHLPVRVVPDAITPEAVARATFWLAWLLARLSPRPPRVVLAGLNPHAGEAGLLGDEELRAIAPGLHAARLRLEVAGIEAELSGPMGAESAFRLARDGAYDGVVAMYHDQATIPMKLLGFGDAVNVSLGLPLVRTSVDHGTAYDRAGKPGSDASGMRAALALAHRLTAGPSATPMSGRSSAAAPSLRSKLGIPRRPQADGSAVAKAGWHVASALSAPAPLCFLSSLPFFSGPGAALPLPRLVLGPVVGVALPCS